MKRTNEQSHWTITNVEFRVNANTKSLNENTYNVQINTTYDRVNDVKSQNICVTKYTINAHTKTNTNSHSYEYMCIRLVVRIPTWHYHIHSAPFYFCAVISTTSVYGWFWIFIKIDCNKLRNHQWHRWILIENCNQCDTFGSMSYP